MILDLKPPSTPLKNRIHSIGVELEGGWTSMPLNAEFHNDGSVNLSSDARRRCNVVGEVVSRPMQPIALKQWLTACYPQEVNHTCGFHLHLGFEREKRERYYQWLMHPDYQDTLIAALEAWADAEQLPPDHPLRTRLRGENSYCEKQFWADAQAGVTRKNYSHGGKHRYTIVNYCYGQHGTIEIRVLPMFADAAQAYRAAMVVIHTTNAVLSKLAIKERPIEDTIQLNAMAAPYRETAKLLAY